MKKSILFIQFIGIAMSQSVDASGNYKRLRIDCNHPEISNESTKSSIHVYRIYEGPEFTHGIRARKEPARIKIASFTPTKSDCNKGPFM